MNKHIAAAIAACTQQTSVHNSLDTTAEYLVILPLGQFKGVDGRPNTPDGYWHLSLAAAHAIAAKANATKAELFIDYDHQSLHKEKNGQPAPAAGWGSNLVVVEGVGLCAKTWRWTPKASQAITDGEYRYISPVFLYDPATGNVTDLINLGLVNEPNIDELPEAALAAAGRLMNTALNNANAVTTDVITTVTTGVKMDEILEQLRWMLNLPLSANADDIKAELQKLIARLSDASGQTVAANSKNVFDALDVLQHAKDAMPNPAEYVPMAMFKDLQHQLATLSANSTLAAATQLVDEAIGQGKILPSGREWALAFCSKDVEGFKAHVAHAPALAALTAQQTKTVAANSQTHTAPMLDDAVLAVAAQMGIDASTLSV